MSVNVRVEARKLPPNASLNERVKAVGNLYKALKKACNEVGVMQKLKEKEFYIRKTDIRRKKEMLRKLAPLEAEKAAKKEEQNQLY